MSQRRVNATILRLRQKPFVVLYTASSGARGTREAHFGIKYEAGPQHHSTLLDGPAYEYLGRGEAVRLAPDSKSVELSTQPVT